MGIYGGSLPRLPSASCVTLQFGELERRPEIIMLLWLFVCVSPTHPFSTEKRHGNWILFKME